MNNIIIGANSGLDLKDESNYFILGDDISIQDVKEKKKDRIVFLGEKTAISFDVLSEEWMIKLRNINLKL